MVFFRLLIVCGLFVSVFCFSGCCGKYKDQIAAHEKVINGLKKEKAGLEKAKAELEEKVSQLQQYNSALENELTKLGFDKEALAKKYAKIQEDLRKKMQDIEEKQKMIEEMRKRQESAKARLATLKNMLSKFRSMIEAGKLKVKIRNGRMVLELPSAILFPSGSAKLSEEGKATLVEVAQVLRGIKEREFQVAGHTDNVPIKTRRFKSNWELSTARAVSVVKFLQECGVAPTSLSAAGYSEYQPVSDNSTEEGRAHNRRIEISLMPNLNELPDLSDLEKEISEKK